MHIITRSFSFIDQAFQQSTTKVRPFSQTSTAPSHTGLSWTMTEWLPLRCRQIWSSRSSAPEPLMRLIGRRIRTEHCLPFTQTDLQRLEAVNRAQVLLCLTFILFLFLKEAVCVGWKSLEYQTELGNMGYSRIP